MSVIWYKIWYDLWHNKLRTILVVLSIAMGVFAVGTTFGLVGQMVPQMDLAHHSTNPSHGTMFLLQPVDLQTIESLQDTPGLEGLDPLNSIEIRYKLKPKDDWKKGSIMMRDYELQVYDVLQLKAGAWPNKENLSVERMHGPFYGIDLGDQVIFEVGNGARSLPITGKIRHPFVPPPSMYDWAWFFSSDEVMEKFGIPSGMYSQFKFKISPPYTPERARQVASLMKENLAKQGITVFATQYQDPVKHWGRAFIDGLAVVTKVLAVVSMLLSAVLVSNTLMAILTQQTNQVGILKAIGGGSLSVVRTYMAGVVAYCILALVIAVPLGAIASFRITSMFLGLYNIEYEQFAFTNQAVLFQLMAGLVVPLVAGLIPILRGANMTVRQAIASYGLGGDFGSNRFDRWVEKVSGFFFRSYNAMAITNTFRRKGRLFLTQVVLIIAGVMYLMVMGLSSSIKATLDAEFNRRTHDIIFSFERLQRIERINQMVGIHPGVLHSDMWLVAPATILVDGRKSMDTGLGSQLQGVPVDDPMYKPMLVEGRWLMPGDGRVVVMNKETAEDENIQVGDMITLDLGDLGEGDWKVVGFYRVFLMFGGGFSVDALYAPRAAVFEATQKYNRASTLLVRTESHSSGEVESVAEDLKDLLHDRNISIMQTETMPALRKTMDISFSMVVYMLLALSWIVALVGGVGLMGALSISVIERTKEIGVMRAIGAQSHIIMGMFVLEGLFQGIMSWLIAVPTAYLITPMLSTAMGLAMFQSALDYRFNFQAVFIWLAALLVISALSAILPARNATRINVRQCLFYE